MSSSLEVSVILSWTWIIYRYLSFYYANRDKINPSDHNPSNKKLL